MLYLLNKDVRTVRWNGEPLHESTSAIVKETMNGDFTLTVKYPISDSGIYQLIQEDMLIKAPTPVLGAQLFRIKKPIEHNDHLEITAYHISDDVMQRSITPMSVTSQSCGMALSRMVQNTKTALGDFSFNSDIQDRRTFNTTETETLYSVLLNGKHSIVGTWEGELVRDNFAITVKKSRGENRGVVITTHKNLKDYQRTRNIQNVVTRIHAKSTFKPEGSEKETTIRVTVDSPLINSYPYINEKEYENNNTKTVEELKKWAQSKFSNEGIDKVSDAIKIEAYELDGQVVHIGDTVNLKSWKHNVDAFKKAIAYEFDALKEEYISLTFDDKAGTGGARTSGGLSSAADAILGVTDSAQEIALEKALQNADLDFDHKAGLLRQEISDGIELAKARAEEVKQELSNTIDQRFSSFDNGPLQEVKRRAEEALRNAGASSLLAQEAKRISLDSVTKLEEFKRQATSAQTALSGDLDALKRTVTSEVNQASEHRRTTTEALSRMTGQMDGFATKSEVRQDVADLTETFARLKTDTNNLISGAKSEITLAKTEFKKTADGLSAKMSAVESYVGQDGQRQEALRRYTREESARQATAVREQISRDYVGKSTYQEDVRGLERRFSAISTQTNNDIATKIAQYKQTVDGQFASITSQIAGKANQTDFQHVRETSQLYERIIGSNENDIADKVARMALTNHLFQVEVAKINGQNLIRNFDWNGLLPLGSYSSAWKFERIIDENSKSGYTLKATCTKSGNGGFNKVLFDLRGNEFQGKDMTWSWEMKSSRPITFYDMGFEAGGLKRNVPVSTEWERISNTFKVAFSRYYSSVFYANGWRVGDVVYIRDPQLEEGSIATTPKRAPEDTEEAVRTVQSQLAGSWSVQNLTSAGALVSQINATNNQILIEAEKIRLKGKTLLDELTAIQGYFKRLFVGEGNFAKLNAEIIGSNTITADKLIMDQAMARLFVSSDIFTNTLAVKEAFINKLRSVVVTATLLEGYKGRIGGFQIGTHDKDPSAYWLTGQNQFAVGMSNGSGRWYQTALWVNWGNNWDNPGNNAWFVKNNGEMNCYNTAHFWNTPVVNGNLRVTGRIFYDSRSSGGKFGYWISSSRYTSIEPHNSYLYLYPDSGKYDWITMNKEISDRRYKTNIKDSTVSGLDIINSLKTYSYRKEYDGKIEDISCGIMAQDVQKYAPEAFFENPDGAYSYNTFALVPYLIKAIQELNQKIEKLEKSA